MRYFSVAAIVGMIMSVTISSAQERQSIPSDTLPASYKEANRVVLSIGGKCELPLDRLAQIASPTGEGSIVQYVKSLPGVASGGDGFSSLYVRGGDSGTNLTTLDGVPIYASSHLLGLAASYPTSILKSAHFYKDGFEAGYGNISSSHILLESRDGKFTGKPDTELYVSNMMTGGHIITPLVKDKLSISGSFRISPAGLIFNLSKPFINRQLLEIDDFSLCSGDIFAKAEYLLNKRNTFSLSYLGTLDKYEVTPSGSTPRLFGWDNSIVNGVWKTMCGNGLSFTARVYYNSSKKSQQLCSGNGDVSLALNSSLDEISLSSEGSIVMDKSGISFGLSSRAAQFFPSSVNTGTDGQSLTDQRSYSLLNNLFGQYQYASLSGSELKTSLRLNCYLQSDNVRESLLFTPEFSFAGRLAIVKGFGVDISIDYISNFYHTLEGIPTGWSLDMMIPCDRSIPVEITHQCYGGFYSTFGRSNFKAGGYCRYMQNLVYFKDAASLFNISQAGWHDEVECGTGTSYGIETEYDYHGNNMTCHLSYTWSRSDRLFDGINEGMIFHAKFDRRHVANVFLDFNLVRTSRFKLSANTTLTFQSGHWETIQDGIVPVYRLAHLNSDSIDCMSSVNNYKMDDIFRWDVAICCEFICKNANHNLSLGVYNLLNRHNPFSLFYNPESGRWYSLSLIPIMPSLRYCISF